MKLLDGLMRNRFTKNPRVRKYREKNLNNTVVMLLKYGIPKVIVHIMFQYSDLIEVQPENHPLPLAQNQIKKDNVT